eukprot:TRINITY_DN11080_c0_g1_i1.p1 TRINITY_DN11080_c0_g1~~TRINITY_DN11080_c0_g1_i1.p1  ORF type:complete len:392 (+),score=51.91 TRINITY_DN11080_c0_g1_i1:165-1340(+)
MSKRESELLLPAVNYTNHHKDDEGDPPQSKKKTLLLGIAAVVGLTLDWSTQGEYGNWISGPTQPYIPGGYLISYWAFSQFILCFPLVMFIEGFILRYLFKKPILHIDRHDYSEGSRSCREWCDNYFKESMELLCRKSNYTKRKCALVAIGLGAIFFLSAWTWFLSLEKMPASYNTAAYQSTTVFVFIFSILLLQEKPRPFKVISVVVCVVGIILLGVGSRGDAANGGYKQEWLGYTLCLFSAACYALYEVLFAKFFGSQPIRSTFLFLSLNGLFVLIFLWPIFFFINSTGLEPFLSPFVTSRVTTYLILNGFLQIGFVSFFLFGISITGSPLFITIGSMLTIPATALYEKLACTTDCHDVTGLTIAGDVVIGLGFVVLLLDIIFSKDEHHH